MAHFWPGFRGLLDAVPDTRFRPFITYDKRFLLWWGLLLFGCTLRSRRQLDFDLRDAATQVLGNVNRLAGTQQPALPVHDTLDHFLGHVGAAALAGVRTQMVRRLIRMKALNRARLLGSFVIAVDGTGHLRFARRHCAHCVVQHHAATDVYLHLVEEAKLVGLGGLSLSVGTEWIENADMPARGDAEQRKQDCELRALGRLVPALKQAFPQTPLCLTGDALYACHPVIELVEAHGWTYVCTFKPGRAPAAWAEFQTLLALCPENTVRLTTPAGTPQEYRWVTDVPGQAAEKRPYLFNALQCTERTVGGRTTTFAWMTDLPVTRETVVAIATKGGRARWQIDNEGFNVQKNSDLNLEHAYSTDPERLKAYYYLLQIAHLMLQLLERGSLLRQVAHAEGKTPMALWGSLKNIARRLLEDLRREVLSWPAAAAPRMQIRLDDSS